MTACCPKCGSTAVVRHCGSPTCTWVTCPGCRCFGTEDGQRFIPRRAA